MSLDLAAMTTLVVQKLQSAGTMDYTVSEVTNAIQETSKEYARFQPHLVPVVLQIESRYGTCDTTVANELTDTVKGQFLTTDPTYEKVVFNSTDHTWAVVSACASTSAVTLSRDIFIKGENYNIYNQRCWNNKQLYIGGMPDYVEIDSVEYPIGQKRNFEILNDVLEIDVDTVEDSDAGSAITTLPDVDVLIRFNRPHVLTPLTDLVGKLAATAADGATTLSGSSLQAAGTLSIGDEFYIQGQRTLYTITTAATIAVTAAMSFYPGLESALASTTTTFTFTKSSLSAQQEDTFADLCAARLAIDKAPKMYMQANSAIATLLAATTAIANMSALIQSATASITLAGSAILAGTIDSAAATVAIAKIDAQVAAGTIAAASALALINTIPTALNAENDWMQKGALDLNNATGYLQEGIGYLRAMGADHDLSKRYFEKATAELNSANAYAGQANSDFRELQSRLAVSNNGRNLEAWGQSKLQETLRKLIIETKPKVKHRYPTEL